MRYGVVRKVLVAGAAADEVRGSDAEQACREVGLDLIQGHALLRHVVALADRDRIVLERVSKSNVMHNGVPISS